MVHDVLVGLSEDGGGMGWYGARVRVTFDEISRLHPELDRDPQSKSMFAAILAATSQGYTVMQNFEIAEAVYYRWRTGGRLPVDLKFSTANADHHSGNTSVSSYNFNAFVTNCARTTPNGANDVLVTNFNWQTARSVITGKSRRFLEPRSGLLDVS